MIVILVVCLQYQVYFNYDIHEIGCKRIINFRDKESYENYVYEEGQASIFSKKETDEPTRKKIA